MSVNCDLSFFQGVGEILSRRFPLVEKLGVCHQKITCENMCGGMNIKSSGCYCSLSLLTHPTTHI